MPLSSAAGLAWTTGAYTPAKWTPTATNVLAGLSATMTGSWYTESGVTIGNNVAILTDGIVPGATMDHKMVAALKDNATLAWSFSATPLNRINIYSRWGGGGRDGINILKVEVKQTGSDDWIDLVAPALAYGTKAVDGNNASAGALQAVLAQSDGSHIATGVTALRLTFGTQDNNGTGYVEIEAIASIDPPAMLSDAFVYSGANQFVTFSPVTPYFVVSGVTNATRIGTYSCFVTPISGYGWSDNTARPIEYSWRILKAADPGATPLGYNAIDVSGSYSSPGRVGGLSWTGAARAYAVNGEVILVYQDASNTGTFSLDERWTATARVLLVGGGGPGGYNSSFNAPAGGGGAGAMREIVSTVFEEGSYTVTVGKGGTPATDKSLSGSNGGDSVLTKDSSELYRAIGGGAGGNPNGENQGDTYANVAWGRNGGSGGGGAVYYSWWNKDGHGGTGVTGQGFAGGWARGCNTGSYEYFTSPAGGGGAGGVGGSPAALNTSGAGGTGRPSDITGETVMYAGGGAGGAYAAWNHVTYKGGAGGGGSSSAMSDGNVSNFRATSAPGTDGLGGGGAGSSGAYNDQYSPTSVWAEPGRGGNGIVVVRFTKLKLTPFCAGVTATGFQKMYNIGTETVIVYTNVNAQGSFTLPHKSRARVLVVAGGGPGGYNGAYDYVGAGGGAGGMLVSGADGVSLKRGTYTISVGAGGTPSTSRSTKGTNGGDSYIAYDSVKIYHAIGGGAGGNANASEHSTGSSGGSGGGGAVAYVNDGYYGQSGGSGIDGQGYAGSAALNGKTSAEYRNAGGGGGAGQAASVPGSQWQGGRGGDGLPCDITGEMVWYAGGGAGGCTTYYEEKSFAGGKGGGGSSFSMTKTEPRRVESQSGTDGLGGGGAGAAASVGPESYVKGGRGGHGIVIVRILEDIHHSGLLIMLR